MTTRPNVLIQATCISLLLMLAPGTAVPQDQKEPSSPQVEKSKPAAEQTPPQQPGTLILPEEKPAVEAPDVPAAVEPPAPVQEKSTVYIIRKGDTLWDISNSFYRDPFLWPFIWKANTYVTNADLIYPGNKLLIPSLAPIERAMEAPPKAAVRRPVRPKPEEAKEEAPAEVSGLILPEEKLQPLVDAYAMLSAGFVNDVESDDMIVGAEERGKTALAYDDVVYVDIRSRENVNIGDKFLIYTPLDPVRHPRTGERVGRLIRGLGILQITAKDPAADVLTARITLSFDTIEKGHLLTPYQEPMLMYQSPERKAKDISGYILEVTDHRTLSGQTDFVYLDKGSADGIDPGDRFLVYAEPEKRGFPRKLIGEVLVFLVKERSSTAVVQKNSNPLAKGDAIDFKK